jgi:hypothetical protein
MDMACKLPAFYAQESEKRRRGHTTRRNAMAAMVKWASALAALGRGCDVLLLTAVQFKERRWLLPPSHAQRCSFAVVNEIGLHRTPGWTELNLTLFADDLVRSAHVIKMPCGTTRPVVYASEKLASKVSLTAQLATLAGGGGMDVAVLENPRREWSLLQELLATSERMKARGAIGVTHRDDRSTHQRLIDHNLDLHRDWTVPDTSYIIWSPTPAARDFAASWFVETVNNSVSDQARNSAPARQHLSL